jgi:hypothetical protein
VEELKKFVVKQFSQIFIGDGGFQVIFKEILRNRFELDAH